MVRDLNTAVDVQALLLLLAGFGVDVLGSLNVHRYCLLLLVHVELHVEAALQVLALADRGILPVRHGCLMTDARVCAVGRA